MKLYIYYETINTHNSDGTEHYLAARTFRYSPVISASHEIARRDQTRIFDRAASLSRDFFIPQQRRGRLDGAVLARYWCSFARSLRSTIESE